MPTFTAQALQIFPTVGFAASPFVILPPTALQQQPTNPPTPINIVLLSPLPGSILAGNIQHYWIIPVHPSFYNSKLSMLQSQTRIICGFQSQGQCKPPFQMESLVCGTQRLRKIIYISYV
ncbi:MAG UNVERIFIED_CONTAM: hypothetical protein LVT10_17515 [Anaerolineae bacterium]